MKRVRTIIGSISSPYQDLTFEQLRIYYIESGLTLYDNFLRSLELVTEDDKFNYAVYLLSDNNGCSIKVAKYSGCDRYDLIENEEYGFCSLIKATKSVLDKMKLENRTFAKITFDGRVETKLLNPTALREAVINAIVHNDYTSEVPPKFEFFSDRLEITSKGGIPLGLTREEFLSGISQPVNKILMRIFRDLEMVEQLGSGVPRIIQEYDSSTFHFSENFIRVVFPYVKQASDQASDQATAILKYCSEPKSIAEIMEYIGVKNRTYFKRNHLNPLIDDGIIKLTIPDKPTSPNQRYFTVTEDNN